MNCIKCGISNPDDLLNCRGCGHKLQSGRESPVQDDPFRGRSGLVELLGDSSGPGKPTLRPYLEAWGVALTVMAAAYLLLDLKLYWPLYPLACAAAGFALLRGMV